MNSMTENFGLHFSESLTRADLEHQTSTIFQHDVHIKINIQLTESMALNSQIGQRAPYRLAGKVRGSLRGGGRVGRRDRHTQLLHAVIHQLLFLLLIGDGLGLQLAGLWMRLSQGTVSTQSGLAGGPGSRHSHSVYLYRLLPHHPGQIPHLHALPKKGVRSCSRGLKARP